MQRSLRPLHRHGVSVLVAGLSAVAVTVAAGTAAAGADPVPVSPSAGPQASATAAPCPTVQLLAVPGTWETNPAANPLVVPGMLAPIAAGLEKDAPAGVTVAARQITYPAQVGGPIAGIATGQPLTFDQSLAAGVKNLEQTLKTIADRCPLTSFDVAGYSQGAAVAHNVLAEIGNGKGPVSADRIMGAALVADPERPSSSDATVGQLPGSDSTPDASQTAGSLTSAGLSGIPGLQQAAAPLASAASSAVSDLAAQSGDASTPAVDPSAATDGSTPIGQPADPGSDGSGLSAVAESTQLASTAPPLIGPNVTGQGVVADSSAPGNPAGLDGFGVLANRTVELCAKGDGICGANPNDKILSAAIPLLNLRPQDLPAYAEGKAAELLQHVLTANPQDVVRAVSDVVSAAAEISAASAVPAALPGAIAQVVFASSTLDDIAKVVRMPEFDALVSLTHPDQVVSTALDVASTYLLKAHTSYASYRVDSQGDTALKWIVKWLVGKLQTLR